MRTIILIGPAGSGKGTQGAHLVKTRGLIRVEAGELIREGAKEDSALGRYLHEIHESGQHVIDGVIRDLISMKIATIPEGTGLLFDGYPRTLGQAKDLDIVFEQRGIAERVAVFVNVSDNVARERLMSRSVCTSCKAIFPTRDTTTCPTCGHTIEVRDYDLGVEAINKRLKWFHENVMSAIEYYREQGIVKEVNGEQDVDAVQRDIAAALV